ncbi:MAG: WD40 repeat domain-containing protein [Deltaproteobacteria bacterium]|nr:WD40 repeat domain-containing protein [Deltaproteobacteria bacterium]
MAADSRAAREVLPLVDEDGEVTEAVLEVLLAPGEFPGRRFAHVIEGDAALFCIDSSLGSAEPFAEVDPQRVRWPAAAGLPIAVRGGAVRLEPVDTDVDDEDLDRGLTVRWILRPLGQVFADEPRFEVEVVEVQVLATGSGEQLLLWKAPPAPPTCRPISEAGRPTCNLAGISREARALALSPDGRLLALALGGLRPRLEVYDVRAEPRLAWQGLFPTDSGGAVEVAFSADGQWVVALTGAGRMHRFDASSGGRHLAIPSVGLTARALPPGRVMAVAGERGEVTLWYLADGTIAWRLPPRKLRGPVDRIAASGDGRRFATLEYDEDRTVVRVWAVRRRAMLAQITVDAYSVTDIALDHAGEQLYLAHEHEGLYVADVSSPDTAPVRIKGDAAVRCRGRLQWIPGRRLLACAVAGGVVQLNGSGERVSELTTDVDASDWLVAAASGGRRIAAVGAGHLLVWWRDER